jgi:predicted nuclease with TOPRIM domain
MNKTKVDDILLEMLTRETKAIEDKFAKGDGLNPSDIHTLLLKSQYNHINHLDTKLDEVTKDVASLKGDFNNLKGDFNNLRGEFKLLETKLTNDMKSLETKLTNDMKSLEKKVETDNALLRADFKTFKAEIISENEKNQVKTQQMIIDLQKQMMTTIKWYIGGAGIIIITLKIVDIIIK